ncbi:predicted protein [Naegleria gruberi]|uniref:Predicted protein n=1 Tax=Naegleria gruberi TaxID=5762 RepID=D2VE19_NAEGR|nr:uncharacterized protein NAEGRDRAFT_67119 [Naegleria gruberi]EFC45094.1 predicted protein [Naegleria gruberi]|eukprot:XP_002677838.1 predicted protein [Naegleria gruberi strain NEG-M]
MLRSLLKAVPKRNPKLSAPIFLQNLNVKRFRSFKVVVESLSEQEQEPLTKKPTDTWKWKSLSSWHWCIALLLLIAPLLTLDSYEFQDRKYLDIEFSFKYLVYALGVFFIYTFAAMNQRTRSLLIGGGAISTLGALVSALDKSKIETRLSSQANFERLAGNEKYNKFQVYNSMVIMDRLNYERHALESIKEDVYQVVEKYRDNLLMLPERFEFETFSVELLLSANYRERAIFKEYYSHLELAEDKDHSLSSFLNVYFTGSQRKVLNVGIKNFIQEKDEKKLYTKDTKITLWYSPISESDPVPKCVLRSNRAGHQNTKRYSNNENCQKVLTLLNKLDPNDEIFLESILLNNSEELERVNNGNWFDSISSNLEGGADKSLNDILKEKVTEYLCGDDN